MGLHLLLSAPPFALRFYKPIAAFDAHASLALRCWIDLADIARSCLVHDLFNQELKEVFKSNDFEGQFKCTSHNHILALAYSEKCIPKEVPGDRHCRTELCLFSRVGVR